MGDDNIIQSQVSYKGKVQLGSGNIIEDRVTFITSDSITIGNNNYFATGCTIKGNVGDNNELGAFSVADGIGSNNVIGPKVVVSNLGDGIVAYESNKYRLKTGISTSPHEKHVEYLQNMMPRYHKMQ